MSEVDPPRLTRVFHLIDGMVVALDQYGNHMPEFEGHSRTAIPKILAKGWRGPIPVVREVVLENENPPAISPDCRGLRFPSCSPLSVKTVLPCTHENHNKNE